MTFPRPNSNLRKPDDQWRQHAACVGVDPDVFFVGRGGSTWRAKKVCDSCPVSGECLTYAIAYKEHFGIWGGLSEKQRTNVRNHLISVGLYETVVGFAVEGKNGVKKLSQLTGLDINRLSRIPPIV